MEEFYKNTSWDFVSILLSTIIGVIGILLAIRQNKSKKLIYHINSVSPLFTINSQSISDIEVRYKNKIVSQLYRIEIIIENIGNIPIKKSDYEEPINIIISECIQIFSAEVIETLPDNLGASLKVKEKIVVINPLLLNPKDFMKLQIIFQGENNTLSVKARIADIKFIENKRDIIKNRKNRWVGLSFIISGIFISRLPYFEPYLSFTGSFIFGWGVGYIYPFEKIIFRKKNISKG